MIAIFVRTLALLLIPSVCLGGLTGEIRGRVRSSYGDPIEGADVVVEETGASRKTTGSGFFVFLGLEPGSYTVHVSNEGDSKADVRGIQVHADLSARISVTLEAAKKTSTSYSEPFIIEPTRIFIFSGVSVRILPFRMPAQCIRTLSSKAEIDNYF